MVNTLALSHNESDVPFGIGTAGCMQAKKLGKSFEIFPNLNPAADNLLLRTTYTQAICRSG